MLRKAQINNYEMKVCQATGKYTLNINMKSVEEEIVFIIFYPYIIEYICVDENTSIFNIFIRTNLSQ